MDATTVYMADALFVMVVALVFFIWIFFTRRKYSKLAETHIIAEFWPERGNRYPVLAQVVEEKDRSRVDVPHEENGNDKRIGQYFFQRGDKYFDKWPRKPPLGISWCQADFPIVSWPESSANPISPYRPQDLALTPDALFCLRDEEFLFFSRVAQEESQRYLEMYLKAKAQSVPRNMFLLMMMIAIGVGVISIVLLVRYGGVIELLAQSMGII